MTSITPCRLSIAPALPTPTSLETACIKQPISTNWHHSSTNNPAISAWIPNDLGKKDAAGRVIADFGQGLPAGTTYELSFPET